LSFCSGHHSAVITEHSFWKSLFHLQNWFKTAFKVGLLISRPNKQILAADNQDAMIAEKQGSCLVRVVNFCCDDRVGQVKSYIVKHAVLALLDVVCS
jgi:hypothetical protein